MNDALERRPCGWSKATLGELTVPKVDQGAPSSEVVPYIDISSIDRHRKEIGELRGVDAGDAPTRARQWVRAGDVLVSMTRPNLNAVALVPNEFEGAVASTGFDVLRAIEVLPQWIFSRVRSHTFVADVCEGLQGVVYPAIRPRDVRRHELPIPPLGEQRRIVEALDSYFSRLDDAVATLERVQRNLKRYRASVLKAAVEGRLVPTGAELARKEGRDYEPADVLLPRILQDRKARWIAEEAEKERAKAEAEAKKAGKPWTKTDDQAALAKARTAAAKKYKEPAPPDTSELPELPEGWCWATVEQLAGDVRYGSSAKTSSGMNDGVPILRMGNIVDGRLDFGVLKYLPQEHEEFPDLLLQVGDLVFNRTNSAELVGKTAVYRRSDLTCSLASYLIRVRFAQGIVPEYVSFFINSLAGRRWIASVVSQQVGQANVNGTKLKRCVVPMPPAAEQVRIVEEAERLLSISFAVEQVALVNSERSQRLRQSILKWAFEGKLVDQDPSDEPASVLLARIKAERQKAQAARATKKPARTPRKKKSA